MQPTSGFSGVERIASIGGKFLHHTYHRQRADIDVHHNLIHLLPNPIKLLMTISSHPTPLNSALSEPPSYTRAINSIQLPTIIHNAQPNDPSDNFHSKKRNAWILKSLTQNDDICPSIGHVLWRLPWRKPSLLLTKRSP